jgi:hypothetical protein
MRKLVIMVGVLALLSLQPVQAQRGNLRSVEWETFVEASLGTRVEYPADVFSVSEGPSERGIGEQFRTADGRAQLLIYSLPNDRRETPASFLRNHLKAAQAELVYRRVTASFFAISAINEGMIYYSRCNFSSNAGGAAHCIDLRYPAEEKRAWDGVVTRISRSLRPLVRT